jgi:rhamnosyl/mannosyltransferase
MRVLQANKFYYPHVGGVEAVVQAIAEGLTTRGYEQSVLASQARGFGEQTTVSGVPVQKTPSLGTALSVPLAPTYPLSLRRAARAADVVHHHLPNPLGVVSQFAVDAECSLVATYHSDIVRQATALKAYAPILRRFLDRLDHIMVTSPRLRDNSAFLAPHRQKCTVVPLSIDVEGLPAPDRPANFPLDQGDPFVLFAGRLNYYKGVEYLLEAATQFDTRVVIAGDGERRESLEAKAAELGIGDQVHFLGYVSDEALQYCYEQATVFVLPSVEPSEAFGLVQLEAMAHETPIVNTNLPTGVPWVSQDGETGLTVPPRDSDALAEAIEQLLADPSLRTRYGRAARTRVETTFTREQMLDGVERVYDEVT